MTAPNWDRKKTARPQVKICGITVVEDALACASLGADAIGLVFYPKSPRYVDENRAADICSATRATVAKIGVFVDETYDAIMDKAAYCGLSGIQLHGLESPELAGQLRKAGLLVIKALYTNKAPGLDEAKNYADVAFLVECAGGKLPGGNALPWDWGSVRAFGEKYPMILAGGLSPENVKQAVAAANPAGVDVSSGVESAPGRKDINKIREFINTVHSMSCTQTKEIFR
jgi:phosphoribosylanthranilate isomerase